MHDSTYKLATLRARIGAIEGGKPSGSAALFALGHDRLDARLGGGIARGRLHELFAADPVDQSSVTGFALMLAMRLGSDPFVWLRQDGGVRSSGELYAPGLIDLGCDPARIIEVQVPDETALLRAAGDAVRCQQLAAVLIEPWKGARAFDLTASRRLSIAAEKSGVTVLALRSAADPGPSAAYTRWRVRAIPSQVLEAGAPGLATIEITLLRHRGGIAAFHQRLEWDRDQAIFHEPPLSGAVVPVPAGGSFAAGPARRRAG
ncbi:MAG TPA: hypothetical protein VNS79_10860 [Sphingobium sp.]|nr:hypothetical protein [Sphingobium sp.]